jgi:DNA helicase HerA-like ATPase
MDLSNVRIREHFGLVSSNTRTGEFCFLVSSPKNRASVEKHDYVIVDHPLFGEVCPILAVISEITSCDEVAGSSIGDKMGKMLATAQIIGYVDLRNENKPICELLIPPSSGGRVYIPLKNFLEDILNRNAKGEAYETPIQIGFFEASSAEEQGSNGKVKCLLDAQDFISKHTVITGVTGAGKTHTAKLLVQEISDKTSAQIIILDSYNEYSNEPSISAKTAVVNAKIDKDGLAKEIKKNKITILNGHGLTPEEKIAFYVDTLKLLLKLRLEEKTKPFFIVIEEADYFKGETLNQVVAEGRKIGIFACLLTTHPAELGGKILAQMGNQIIGKATNKEDMEYLANVVGTSNILSGLAIGEWIINGINANRPMKISMS